MKQKFTLEFDSLEEVQLVMATLAKLPIEQGVGVFLKVNNQFNILAQKAQTDAQAEAMAEEIKSKGNRAQKRQLEKEKK